MKKIRKYFFTAVSIWSVLVILLGFAPSYFIPLASGNSDHSLIIHIHTVVFSGWMIFFIIQIRSIFKRRAKDHIKRGKKLVYYAVILVFIGMLTGIIRSLAYYDQGNIEQATGLMGAIHRDMLFFVILFSVAIYFKNNSYWHKKFILYAQTLLLVAAVFRISFLHSVDIPFFVEFIWLLPIYVDLILDLIERKWVGLFNVLIILLLTFSITILNYFLPFSKLLEFWMAFS